MIFPEQRRAEFRLTEINFKLRDLELQTHTRKTISKSLQNEFKIIFEKLRDPSLRAIFTISDINFIRFQEHRISSDSSRNTFVHGIVMVRNRVADALRHIRDRHQTEFRTGLLPPPNELELRIRELESQINENNNDDDSELEEITLESLKNKKILFGIMPFASEFNDVWEGAVKRSAKSNSLFPLRVDMITQSSDISDDIINAIKKANVIVVDVTKNNPNVMFEFGYALALKKSPIVISQSTDYLSFDIQNMRTIIYQNTWQGIEKLNTELSRFIKGTSNQKRRK